MSVRTRHILRQGPVVGALARTALAAMKTPPTEAVTTPTPEIAVTVPARSDALIRDYIRNCGGNPSWYRGTVPAHLFPQWGFPVISRTLAGIPYDLTKVLNAGCRIDVNQPLPAGEPLHLRASLRSIDDNGKRALLEQRLVTGTDSAPEALVCHVRAFVPLKRDESGSRKKKERPRVPLHARELGRWRLSDRAGWEFAVLTGDFNPIHWVPPYARAAGFRNVILHGFATLARALETLNKARWSGDVSRLLSVEVRFTKPLVLPAKVGVFLGDDGSLTVGTAHGGPAYLSGTVRARGLVPQIAQVPEATA